MLEESTYCCSTLLFHQGSRQMTRLACVRLRPRPPDFRVEINIRFEFANSSTAFSLESWLMSPVYLQQDHPSVRQILSRMRVIGKNCVNIMILQSGSSANHSRICAFAATVLAWNNHVS